MNLMYFVPFWPHRYTPFLFREVAWMRGRGHRVAVVSMRQWEDGQSNVVQYGLTDVPVLQVRHRRAGDRALVADAVSLVGGGMRGRPPKPWRQMRSALGLRQGVHEWVWAKKISAFARRHGADVVDAHWMSEAAAAARVLKETHGVPYTVTSHGGDLTSPGLQPIVESASAVCLVSNHLKSQFIGGMADPNWPTIPTRVSFDVAKVRVRPHGLPLSACAQTPHPVGSRLVVAVTGRLDPQKCPLDLVEAVGRLTPEFPNLHVMFIGGGMLEADIRRRAEQLGFAERLTVTGGLPWDEVIARLREATIYCQTSQWEGFGVATLEAASQGLPAVVSRTGAHAEIVLHGQTGFVYEPQDVEGLTTSLRRLLADPALREEMGRAALEHVRANFVFEDFMPRVERMLEAVANGRPLPE